MCTSLSSNKLEFFPSPVTNLLIFDETIAIKKQQICQKYLSPANSMIWQDFVVFENAIIKKRELKSGDSAL